MFTTTTRIFSLLFGLLLLALPFSVEWEIGGGNQLSVPGEPLMVLSALLFAALLARRPAAWKACYKHPLVAVAAFYLLWALSTAPFSSMPRVSLKYALVDLTHGWLFLGATLWLLQHRHWKAFSALALYLLSFLLILLYGWYNYAEYGFRMDASNLVQRPFYFDHTMYSACMALLLPAVLAQALVSEKRLHKMLLSTAGALLLAGIYLSYSRAAWLSLALAGVLACLIVLPGRYRKAWMLILLAGVSLLALYQPIRRNLKENASRARDGSLLSHVESIANPRDVSNSERINRYKCAWRMFLDRPLRGYGAGTYPVQYLPFQRPEEMTRISVSGQARPEPGRGGGAHSEYLTALSELGLPGFLCWLLFPLLSLRSGIRVYRHAGDRAARLTGMGMMLGLITYFMHGLFNNFFHTGKVAALVWIALAVLVYLEKNCVPDSAPDGGNNNRRGQN